jgi:hypothetical protein
LFVHSGSVKRRNVFVHRHNCAGMGVGSVVARTQENSCNYFLEEWKKYIRANVLNFMFKNSQICSLRISNTDSMLPKSTMLQRDNWTVNNTKLIFGTRFSHVTKQRHILSLPRFYLPSKFSTSIDRNSGPTLPRTLTVCRGFLTATFRDSTSKYTLTNSQLQP